MAVAFFTVVLPTPADVAPFQRDMRLAVIDELKHVISILDTLSAQDTPPAGKGD